MKHCRVLVCVAVFLMSMGCSDDAGEGSFLTTTCGDGTLNNDEICDGEAFAEGVKVCPDGMVLKDEAAFACTATCGLDVSKACALPTCGDGILNGGEICDGEQIREDVKVCPDGMVLKEDAVFACTATCSLDISAACTVPSCEDETCQCEPAECGNHVLEDGEICDGEQIREDMKICPEGQKIKEDAVWTCTESCSLDIANACAPVMCGDGMIDAGEMCEFVDGQIILAEGAAICHEGDKLLEDRDLVRCSDKCTIVNDDACIGADEKEPLLYFSEFYAQGADADQNVSHHLYIEIGNLGAATSVSDCYIAGVNPDKTDDSKVSNSDYVFSYSLKDYADKLGNTFENDNNVLTVCYQNEDGWIQGKYDESTMSYEAYEAFLDAAMASLGICQNNCGANDTCYRICNDSYNELIEGIDERAVELRRIHENCDLYIPAGQKALELNATKSTYEAKNYWGIAIVCGDKIHDAIALKNVPYWGAERYCPKQSLGNIQNTFDKIRDVYYSYSATDGLLDKPSRIETGTYGYAVCGFEVIN